jgi:hypothetical protein
MRRLMQKVVQIETERHSESADSSYAPEAFIPCVDNSRSPRNGTSYSNASSFGRGEQNDAGACSECCRYLPCHYFDYIGGTSTGG